MSLKQGKTGTSTFLGPPLTQPSTQPVSAQTSSAQTSSAQAQPALGFATAREQQSARRMVTVTLALVALLLDGVLLYGEKGLPWGDPTATLYLALPIAIGAVAGFVAYLCEIRWRVDNAVASIGGCCIALFAGLWIVAAITEARFSASTTMPGTGGASTLASPGMLGTSATDELARITLVVLASSVAVFQPAALLRPRTAWIIVALDWTVLVGGAVARHTSIGALDPAIVAGAAAVSLAAIGGASFRANLEEWQLHRLDIAAAAIWRRLRALLLVSIVLSVCATGPIFATDLIHAQPHLAAAWHQLIQPLARFVPFSALDQGNGENTSAAARPGAGIGVSSSLIDQTRNGQRIVLRYRVSLAENGPGSATTPTSASDGPPGIEMPLSVLTSYDSYANGSWEQAPADTAPQVVQANQPLWVTSDGAAQAHTATPAGSPADPANPAGAADGASVLFHTRYTLYPIWTTPLLPALDGTVSFGIRTRVDTYRNAHLLNATRPGGYSAVDLDVPAFSPVGGYATYDAYSLAPPGSDPLADAPADPLAPTTDEHTTLTALTGVAALDAQIHALANQVSADLPAGMGPQARARALALRLTASSGPGAIHLDEQLRPTTNSNAALALALRTHATNRATLLTLAVLVLRALGIPARLATGFLPGTADAATGDMVVTVNDYYAFAQLLTAGGWVSVPIIATPRVAVHIVPDVPPTPTSPSQQGGSTGGTQANATATATTDAGGGTGSTGATGQRNTSSGGTRHGQATPTHAPDGEQTATPPRFPAFPQMDQLGAGVAQLLTVFSVMLVMLVMLVLLAYLLWWMRRVRGAADADFYALLLRLLARPARRIGAARQSDPIILERGDPLAVEVDNLCRLAESPRDRVLIATIGQRLHALLYLFVPPSTHVLALPGDIADVADGDRRRRRQGRSPGEPPSRSRARARSGASIQQAAIDSSALLPLSAFLHYHRVLGSFIWRAAQLRLHRPPPTRPERAAHRTRRQNGPPRHHDGGGDGATVADGTRAAQPMAAGVQDPRGILREVREP